MRQLFLEEYRGSGRSTVLALEIIAKAMRYPGTPIKVSDHYKADRADYHLTTMIDTYIQRLQFDGFTFKMLQDGCHLTFKGLR